MIRAILAAAVALLALAASLPLIGAHDDPGGETVQIIARLHEDGRVEFGLSTSEGRKFPTRRYFSPRVTDENWKRSSPITLSDGTEVRIIARRAGETRIEFGVRIDEPRRDFLPTRRFLSRSGAVGRWLSSTHVRLPSAEAEHEHPEAETPTPTPTPEPEEPEEASEPVEEDPPADDDAEQPEAASDVERISGGHRDGLIVNRNVVGDPDAPVLIVEYGDPF